LSRPFAFLKWLNLASSSFSWRHPNLAAAQELCVQAWLKVEEAQKANKDELGGHAQRAKELLEQVNHELKQAAEFADHRK
jgi:hypothetical protein